MTAETLLASWYYQAPNFILAALMWTMLGRVLLGFFVQPDSTNYIWRFFCNITDPAIAVFATVTPKTTAPVVLWLFCFVWLFWLRVAFHFTLLAFDLAPRVS